MSRLVENLVPTRLGPGFRWLLASSSATNLGDGVAAAAGPLLVASLTDDPFLVSAAALLRWAPPLLFGLYAGVLSDRLDRRRIVITANVIRAAVLAVLVVSMVNDTISVTGALVSLGVLTTAEVFADNTTTTLTPMLVDRDDLVVANSRLQTGFITLDQLVGPPIGAALFGAGMVWPFIAELLLVCAGVIMITRIVLSDGRGAAVPDGGGAAVPDGGGAAVPDGRGAAVPDGRGAAVPDGRGAAAATRSAWRDIKEGLQWTVRHPAVRTLVLSILIFNVTYGAAWSVLVLYATQRLGLGAIGFGLLTTVSAVGGLLGTALYGWITRRVSLGNVMRAGLIIETLTHFALAVTTSAPIACVIFFVFGAHAFIWGTTSMTIRQRAVPAHLQGRVNGVNTISVFGGLVVGSVIGGALATGYGVTAPFWFAFLGSAVFVILLWRQLSHVAHADEQPAPLPA